MEQEGRPWFPICNPELATYLSHITLVYVREEWRLWGIKQGCEGTRTCLSTFEIPLWQQILTSVVVLGSLFRVTSSEATHSPPAYSFLPTYDVHASSEKNLRGGDTALLLNHSPSKPPQRLITGRSSLSWLRASIALAL